MTAHEAIRIVLCLGERQETIGVKKRNILGNGSSNECTRQRIQRSLPVPQPERLREKTKSSHVLWKLIPLSHQTDLHLSEWGHCLNLCNLEPNPPQCLPMATVSSMCLVNSPEKNAPTCCCNTNAFSKGNKCLAACARGTQILSNSGVLAWRPYRSVWTEGGNCCG